MMFGILAKHSKSCDIKRTVVSSLPNKKIKLLYLTNNIYHAKEEEPKTYDWG